LNFFSKFDTNSESKISLKDFIHENIYGVRVRVMVFNGTFNTISVISWRSVLLVEEIELPGENHRPIETH
jgi:hypothetical protein